MIARWLCFVGPIVGVWFARRWLSLAETLPLVVVAWLVAAVVLLRTEES